MGSAIEYACGEDRRKGDDHVALFCRETRHLGKHMKVLRNANSIYCYFD